MVPTTLGLTPVHIVVVRISSTKESEKIQGLPLSGKPESLLYVDYGSTGAELLLSIVARARSLNPSVHREPPLLTFRLRHLNCLAPKSYKYWSRQCANML